jgi:hypothetical protein
LACQRRRRIVTLGHGYQLASSARVPGHGLYGSFSTESTR